MQSTDSFVDNVTKVTSITTSVNFANKFTQVQRTPTMTISGSVATLVADGYFCDNSEPYRL